MTAFLMFRLYGPMVSWGDIAVGEQRLSQTRPSKSAVMGLLAAALGIKRDEEEKQIALANGYHMAARVDCEGALLRDYHTVQVPPPDRGRIYYTRKDEMSVPGHSLNTILSQRDYRVDAHYTIAISDNSGPYQLDELVRALKKPIFLPYLGRKSCPLALPLAPKVVQVENLKAAFDESQVDDDFFSGENLVSTNASRLTTYYWEGLSRAETGFAAGGTYLINEPRDQVSSRKRWQFISRKEHQLIVKQEREGI